MTKAYIEIKTTGGYLIHLVCVGFVKYIHMCMYTHTHTHTHTHILGSEDLLNLGPRVPTNFEEDEGNHDSKFRQTT